jgi:hypothetical protein
MGSSSESSDVSAADSTESSEFSGEPSISVHPPPSTSFLMDDCSGNLGGLKGILLYIVTHFPSVNTFLVRIIG